MHAFKGGVPETPTWAQKAPGGYELLACLTRSPACHAGAFCSFTSTWPTCALKLVVVQYDCAPCILKLLYGMPESKLSDEWTVRLSNR